MKKILIVLLAMSASNSLCMMMYWNQDRPIGFLPAIPSMRYGPPSNEIRQSPYSTCNEKLVQDECYRDIMDWIYEGQCYERDRNDNEAQSCLSRKEILSAQRTKKTCCKKQACH